MSACVQDSSVCVCSLMHAFQSREISFEQKDNLERAAKMGWTTKENKPWEEWLVNPPESAIAHRRIKRK